MPKKNPTCCRSTKKGYVVWLRRGLDDWHDGGTLRCHVRE